MEKVHVSPEEALRMSISYSAEAVAVDEKYGFIKEWVCHLTYFDDKFKCEGTVSKGNLTNMNKIVLV